MASVYLVIFLLLFYISGFKEINMKPKILLVHGVGGVQLEAKLNRKEVFHRFCYKVSDWYFIWLSLQVELLSQICFYDNFRLIYDLLSNRMVNQEGVDIRIVGKFGNIESVEYLDPYMKYFTPYYSDVIDALVEKLNFSTKSEIYAPAYDFRKIGDTREIDEYFIKLTEFIEKDYIINKRKFMFIAHSMGSSLISRFLSFKEFRWKETYIYGFYSLNGAFGGSIGSVQSHLFGYSFGFPHYFFFRDVLRIVETSFPSTYYLFPSKYIFPQEEVIVSSIDKNYTIEDLKILVKESDISNISNVMSFIPDIFVESPPGVDMVCAYSYGIQTLKKIKYKGQILRSYYTFEYGEGDGTVPLSSLRLCNRWVATNIKPIEILEIKGVNHHNILSNNFIINNLISYLKHRMNESN